MRTSLLMCASLGVLACDPPPPPPSAPAPEPEPVEAPEAVPPPAAPELSTVADVGEGQGTRIVPQWNGARGHFEYRAITADARFGAGEGLTLLRVGDEENAGVDLNYYGRQLGPGEYPIRPSNDETIADLQGRRDARAFTLVVKHEGRNFQSVSGTVAIVSSDDARITGTFDATVQGLNAEEPIVSRGRFHATPSRFLEGWIDHQHAIREQLRQRARRGR